MVRLLLSVYVFLIPFENLWGYLFGSQTVLKPYRLLGLVVVAVHWMKNLGRGRRYRLDGLDRGFVAIFILGQVMAVVWYVLAGTSDLGRSISDGTLAVFAFLVYLTIKREAYEPAAMARLLRAFVAGTAISVILAYALGVTVEGRFSGFFNNPNSLAVAVVGSLLVTVAWSLFGRRRGAGLDYLVQGGLVLLLLATLLFTGSRGAIIGAVASVPLLGFALVARSGPARQRSLMRVAAFVPVVLIAGVVLASTYEEHEAESTALQRYDLDMARKGSGRLDIWRAAWMVAGDHYFLGVGTNQYPLYHRAYVRKLGQLYTPSMAKHDVVTHSDYVDLLTSFGVFALLIYLSMLVRIYRALRRGLARADDGPPYVAPIMFPLFVFIVIVESFANFSVSPQYFFFMALITTQVRTLTRSST